MSEDKSKKYCYPKEREVVLKVKAHTDDNKLRIRNAGATATLKDGTEMEVSNFFGSVGLVVNLRSPDGSWRDYVIDIQAIGQAVLENSEVEDE